MADVSRELLIVAVKLGGFVTFWELRRRANKYARLTCVVGFDRSIDARFTSEKPDFSMKWLLHEIDATPRVASFKRPRDMQLSLMMSRYSSRSALLYLLIELLSKTIVTFVQLETPN